MRSLAAAALAAAFMGALAQSEAPAQTPLNTEKYIQPPASIMGAVLAPWQKNYSVTNIDPTGERFIVSESAGLTPLKDLGKPYLNLGGLQIDHQANRARSMTTRTFVGLTIRSLKGAPPVEIEVPQGISPSSPVWSPDGRKIAFIGNSQAGSWIYVADASTGKSKRITNRALLGTLESGLNWSSDSTSVSAVLIPTSRPPLPPVRDYADNPRVRISDEKKTSIRTFPDLLQTPDEVQTLVHYITGQLCVVTVSSGAVTEVGKPGMIDSVNPSPDLKTFRVAYVLPQFSYTFPFSSAGRREVLVDVAGKELFELSKRPAQTGDAPPTTTPTPPTGAGTGRGRGGAGQTGAVAPGRRNITWAPDGDGLIFQRRQRNAEGAGKDQVIRWRSPFTDKDETILYEAEQDIQSIVFTDTMKRAIITQSLNAETTFSIVEVGSSTAPQKFFSYRPGDSYSNPGTLVTKRGPKAGSVVRLSNDNAVFFSGTQNSKNFQTEAPRPFIDKVKIADGSKERIFFSKAETYETASMGDDDGKWLLINRQSPKDVPNDFLRETATGIDTKITNNVDYLPAVTQAESKRIQITRPDGFKFWATVTMPRFSMGGEGQKAMFWFYPSETTSQQTYDEGRRSLNINLFRRPSPSSLQLLVLEGWVVVEPDCPIVGTSDRPNDLYVHQLRTNLSATIDELERQKLIDRRLLAIGGHSYGAFSTANAMVQTPFFKAGIAGDGNYNRSLTPFGFQSEPRSYWEAKDMYDAMSAIKYADQMTGALLMYHGQDDQNVGTFLINSERMFDALEYLGKPAALYVYPYEDHGQIGRETRLDMWARWIAWLNKWVK